MLHSPLGLFETNDATPMLIYLCIGDTQGSLLMYLGTPNRMEEVPVRLVSDKRDPISRYCTVYGAELAVKPIGTSLYAVAAWWCGKPVTPLDETNCVLVERDGGVSLERFNNALVV